MWAKRLMRSDRAISCDRTPQPPDGCAESAAADKGRARRGGGCEPWATLRPPAPSGAEVPCPRRRAPAEHRHVPSTRPARACAAGGVPLAAARPPAPLAALLLARRARRRRMGARHARLPGARRELALRLRPDARRGLRPAGRSRTARRSRPSRTSPRRLERRPGRRSSWRCSMEWSQRRRTTAGALRAAAFPHRRAPTAAASTRPPQPAALLPRTRPAPYRAARAATSSTAARAAAGVGCCGCSRPSSACGCSPARCWARPAAQLAAAAPPGCADDDFVSASITPDAMLYAFWSFALWLGVRVMRRGLTPARARALRRRRRGVLVKATSYGLMPGAALALGDRRCGAAAGAAAGAGRDDGRGGAGLAATLGVWWSWWRAPSARRSPRSCRPPPPGRGDQRARAALLPVAVLPAAAAVAGRLRVPRDLRAAGSTALAPGPVGGFGWLEVRFPPCSTTCSRRSSPSSWSPRSPPVARAPAHDRAVAASSSLVAAVLLAGLHWTEYQLISRRRRAAQPGALPAAAGRRRPASRSRRRCARSRRAWRPHGVAAVLGCRSARAHVLSLGLMLERFYA